MDFLQTMGLVWFTAIHESEICVFVASIYVNRTRGLIRTWGNLHSSTGLHENEHVQNYKGNSKHMGPLNN